MCHMWYKKNRPRGIINNMREKQIVKTSIIGIAANLLLAAFKAVVGLITHSIAITLDAVNNTSDAFSSIITVVGTKLAAKSPDYKHPYGHGRVEYLSAMIISAIILYAGVTSLIESVKKIFNPVTPDYTTISLIIVGVAVIVKILLGRYVQSVGRKVNSGSLEASGKDALLDSVISASTLVAAIIYLTTGLSLEAYLGAIISLIIIKAGIDMMRETISLLLGERIESNLSVNIKRSIIEFEDVKGAYDLILHNYGPDIYLGSVHIEIPDDYTISQLDDLTRAITEKIDKEFNVKLMGIGIYASNTKDPDKAKSRTETSKIALSHEFVKGFHGFYKNDKTKIISFDIVVSWKAPDMDAVVAEVRSDVTKIFPGYEIRINLDVDISD